MRLFKADIVDSFLRRFNVPDDVPIEAKMVTRSIASAQTQVEAQNFEIRKNVLKYDEVMNRQRVVIYEERRKVLEGEDLHEQVREFIDDTIAGYVEAETAGVYPEDWDLDRLWVALSQVFPLSFTVDDLIERSGGDQDGLTPEFLAAELTLDANTAYDTREEELGAEVMRELERRVVLSVLDRKWREHLYEMDYLQEGIGLRAMAQKDPLVEFQREGFELFNSMMNGIKEESVGYLFNVEVSVDEEPTGALELGEPGDAEAHPHVSAPGLGPARPLHLEYSAPSVDGEAAVVRTSEDLDEVPELGEDASRAERRRAERAARKRDQKKR